MTHKLRCAGSQAVGAWGCSPCRLPCRLRCRLPRRLPCPHLQVIAEQRLVAARQEQMTTLTLGLTLGAMRTQPGFEERSLAQLLEHRAHAALLPQAGVRHLQT